MFLLRGMGVSSRSYGVRRDWEDLTLFTIQLEDGYRKRGIDLGNLNLCWKYCRIKLYFLALAFPIQL